jgi:cytochrome c oxidase subunit 3
MANDTTIKDVQPHDEHHATEDNLWDGGKSPFNSSYGKIMMWYFLLSDAFTFAGFLIAYGALRFSVESWPVPDFVFSTAPFGIHNAPLIFVTFMTFVLIVSSVTVLRAVQEGKHENKSGVIKWLLITIFGGGIFLGSQAWEWTNLISVEGVTIYNNPFSNQVEKGKYITLNEALVSLSATDSKAKIDSLDIHGKKVAYIESDGKKYFEKVDHYGKNFAKESPDFEAGSSLLVTYHGEYMPGAYKNEAGKVKLEPMGPGAFGALFFFITGFHGFHVLSGLVFMLIIMLNSWSGFYAERKNGYEMVEKIGLYWHFVDLVWVFVFLVFYLI